MGLLRLATCLARPVRSCSWCAASLISRQYRSAPVAQVHVVRSMKQRGIASFFGGGKAENSPRTVKAESAKAAKSQTPSKQQVSEVLKDVNTSGTKRPREVITHLTSYVSEILGRDCSRHMPHYSILRTFRLYQLHILCRRLCKPHHPPLQSSQAKAN